VVSVQEAITQAECDDLRSRLNEAVEAGGGTVIVDLSDVQFIDGAGLEMLSEVADEYASQSKHLKLAALSENCADTLRLTDLIGHFEIFDSAEAAARHFV
jgi:anti-sigma B factor antagonist